MDLAELDDHFEGELLTLSQVLIRIELQILCETLDQFALKDVIAKLFVLIYRLRVFEQVLLENAHVVLRHLQQVKAEPIVLRLVEDHRVANREVEERLGCLAQVAFFDVAQVND
jgi:hypothetical protein